MKAVHQLCYYYNHLSQVKARNARVTRKWRAGAEAEPPRREPSQGAASATQPLGLGRAAAALSCHREARLVISAGSPSSCYEPGLKRGRVDQSARVRYGAGRAAAAEAPAAARYWAGKVSFPGARISCRTSSATRSSAWAKAGCEGGSGPSYGACSPPTRVLHAMTFCLIWEPRGEPRVRFSGGNFSRIGRWTSPYPPLKERKRGGREGGLLRCSLPR